MKKPLLWASLVPVAAFAIYVIIEGHTLSADASFSSRTLSLTLLPLLLLAAAETDRKGCSADSTVTVVISVFLLVMIVLPYVQTR